MDELSLLEQLAVSARDAPLVVKGVGLFGASVLALGGVVGAGHLLERVSTYQALKEAYQEGSFSDKPSFFRAYDQLESLKTKQYFAPTNL